MKPTLKSAVARLSQAETWIQEPSSAATTRTEGELKRALQNSSIHACWALWAALELAGLEEDGAVRAVLQDGQVTLYLRAGGTVAPIPEEQIPAWIWAWMRGGIGVPGAILATTDRHGWALIRVEDPVGILEEDLEDGGLLAICSRRASEGRPLWGRLADQLWGERADLLPLEGRIYAALLAPWALDGETPPGRLGQLLMRAAKACAWRVV